MIDETYVSTPDGTIVKVVEEIQTINTFSWVRGENGIIYKLYTHDLDWDCKPKIIPGTKVDTCECGRSITSTLRTKDHQYQCKCGAIWDFKVREQTFTKRESDGDE